MGKMINFRLNSIAFCSILLIGSFNVCQFASLGQVIPTVDGKPPTRSGGPRFIQPAEDIDQRLLNPAAPTSPLRGGCDIKDQLKLTALSPKNKIARTVSDYPTFFFYLPKTEAELAEFMLLNESGKEIYKQTIKISNLSGIIGVSIPANKDVPRLEIGKSYSWNFTVICNSQDRSGDMMEIGTVRRVELSADIRSQLEKADPREKNFIYAENGIWQDALSNLVAALRAQPSDAALKADWESLLNSVTLGKIAKEPIAQIEPKP